MVMKRIRKQGETAMKKVFSFIFTMFTVLLLSAPLGSVAEAAWVAVVPIQVDDQNVERSADFSGYYWDIMINKFQYPEYELLDDEKVENAIPENGLPSFAQSVLAEVCDKTDADIVVAMKLDKVEENPLSFRREPSLECIMKGEFAGYNRITGKYYYKKMYYKDEIEEILTLKNDWQQNVFASNVKRYVNRVMEDNKKK